jgi:hypothetical protein
MTYHEAIKFKESLKTDSIIEGGMKMHVLVTPLASSDFERYINDYRIYRFKDESAQLYSKNKQFTVNGLWTNGATVVHRNLVNDPIDKK